MPKIDAPVATSHKTEERGKRWVEVPEKDLYEFIFPTIRINLMEFPPGRHYVDAEIADTIEDRVRAKQKADVRTMQRNPDLITQATMNRFGVGRGSGNFVKPEELG